MEKHPFPLRTLSVRVKLPAPVVLILTEVPVLDPDMAALPVTLQKWVGVRVAGVIEALN